MWSEPKTIGRMELGRDAGTERWAWIWERPQRDDSQDKETPGGGPEAEGPVRRIVGPSLRQGPRTRVTRMGPDAQGRAPTQDDARGWHMQRRTARAEKNGARARSTHSVGLHTPRGNAAPSPPRPAHKGSPSRLGAHSPRTPPMPLGNRVGSRQRRDSGSSRELQKGGLRPRLWDPQSCSLPLGWLSPRTGLRFSLRAPGTANGVREGTTNCP